MVSDLTLDALWQHAEHAGCLNPALVDYTSEEAGQPEFGEFLHWCWRAYRWPAKTFHETTLSGGSKPKYLWNCYEENWIAYSAGIGLPLKIKGRRVNESRSGKWYQTFARFGSARAAFEFLYAAWQRLTDAERRQLWEGVCD